MNLTTTLLALLLLFAPWLPTAVLADERKAVPSIALKQEYNDNLYFSTRSRQSDFISTVSPALELMNNTERLQAGLKLQVDSSYYQANQTLDSVDQDFSGSLRYALSPRTNLFTAAGYRRDSRVDSEFTQTGLILGAVPRDRYSYRLGGDYALSELMGMKLTYSFNSETYESALYSDYKSNDVSWELNRDLSTLLSRTVGRMRLGTAKYDYTGTQNSNNGSQTTNYTGTIGAERSYDERFSYFADIGLRYTESTFNTFHVVPTEIPFLFQVVPYQAQTDGTGLTGQAGVTYKGELNDATVAFSHDIGAASGSSGTVERTTLQGNAVRRLNETSRVAFSAGYALNKSTQDGRATAAIDEVSYWLQPRLVYDVTRQFSIETSYSYALVHYNVTSTEAYRNLVLLRLVYQYGK